MQESTTYVGMDVHTDTIAIAVLKPRARKAADRSSTPQYRSNPRSASRPAARAKGAERLPGHSTKRRSPWRWSSSKSATAA